MPTFCWQYCAGSFDTDVQDGDVAAVSVDRGCDVNYKLYQEKNREKQKRSEKKEGNIEIVLC